MPSAQRLRIALAAALSHWALLAAIQVAGFCAYLLPAGSEALDALGYLATIPFIQAQAIVVAAVLGSAAWLLSGNRIARWLIVPVHLAITIFVLADQVFYKVFFDHLRPSLFEVGKTMNVSVAVSSVSKETDLVFYIAAAIAAAGEGWLIWALLRAPARRPSLLPWVALASILLLAGIPAFQSTRYYHLNEHPAIVAGHDWLAGSLARPLAHRKPSHATLNAEPAAVDRDPRLGRLLEEGRKRARRPNIVLVILESVGARTLLGEDGLPDPVFAPNLNRMARRGAMFTAMYTPYPASTRSHMSIHTGGRYVTQGDLHALEYRYQGAMLGRSMQDLGYTTALFSSERLDVENCDVFLKQGGYDRFQDFEHDLASRDPGNLIHSWGAREEYTVGLMDEWLEGARRAGKPFYLEYLNVATHHPYGTPPGYHPPFPGKDAESQYRNAIHYSDRAIAALMESLDRKGLADDTVIAVTGDHGEGFATIHPMNIAHKNFLYEENVRDFLLLMDPRWKLEEPVVSGRISSNADIMPTLLAYAGAGDAELPGRNLLADSFELRKAFFYKLAMPEQWGLRDGKWKYIGEIRSGKAELYDLTADPLERNNLAAQNPQRVEQYAAECEAWFVRTDAEYVARVPDYHPPGGRTLRPEEFRTPGPKIQSVGVRDGEAFAERGTIAANARPVVWDSWVPDTNRRHARWRWTAPSGEESWTDLDVREEWTTTYAPFPGQLPLEAGTWSVTMVQDGQPGLVSRFQVDGGSR
jgi:arylsulfatase A-like enzyme